MRAPFLPLLKVARVSFSREETGFIETAFFALAEGFFFVNTLPSNFYLKWPLLSAPLVFFFFTVKWSSPPLYRRVSVQWNLISCCWKRAISSRPKAETIIFFGLLPTVKETSSESNKHNCEHLFPTKNFFVFFFFRALNTAREIAELRVWPGARAFQRAGNEALQGCEWRLTPVFKSAAKDMSECSSLFAPPLLSSPFMGN